MINIFFALFLILAISLNCAEKASELPYIVFSDKGTNDYMQDRSCITIKNDHAFFGVFDGHGSIEDGHVISDFLSKNLYKNIILNQNIALGFAATNEQLKKEIAQNILLKMGSTAAVAIIRGNKIRIGYVGDSKIALVRLGKVFSTTDHTAEPKSKEYLRISNIALGNSIDIKDIVFEKRNKWFIKVDQSALSMTRAFGDLQLQPYLIVEPQLITSYLSENDEFLILATDGLWDAINPYEITMFLDSQENWRNKAKLIFDTAMKRWSTSTNGSDNIEIIVVNLKELYKKLNLNEKIEDLK